MYWSTAAKKAHHTTNHDDTTTRRGRTNLKAETRRNINLVSGCRRRRHRHLGPYRFKQALHEKIKTKRAIKRVRRTEKCTIPPARPHSHKRVDANHPIPSSHHVRRSLHTLRVDSPSARLERRLLFFSLSASHCVHSVATQLRLVHAHLDGFFI